MPDPIPVPLPSDRDGQERERDAGDPWVVLAVYTTPGGTRTAGAALATSEWEAHAFATLVIDMGGRSWVVDPECPEMQHMEYGDD